MEHLIGIQSEKVENKIERGKVKEFAEAIGSRNPIFIDKEAGLQSAYGENIAPATYPRVLDFGTLNSLKLPSKGLIHGEQTYTYQRPLKVGESVFCYQKLIDCYEKKGMLFVVIKGYGEAESEKEIFNVKQLIIISETVRKENNI